MAEGLDRYATTALADLEPVDVRAVARRAHRRQLKLRSAVIGGVVAAGVIVATAVVVPRSGEDSQQVVTRPDELVGEGYVVTGEPIGSWTQAAEPPFSPRAEAFSDVLSDGRVLVWGGDDGDEGGVEVDPQHRLPDGGIYDVASDSWEPIPAPPIGDVNGNALLEDDRLVVFGRDDEVRRTAVYDIAAGTWTVAPERATLDPGLEYLPAWNGSTLAIVVTGRFSAPEATPRPPPLTTERWTLGDDRWEQGAPFPLMPRTSSGADDEGDLLAIWGGTSTILTESDIPPLGNDTGLAADGALYDIAADTWTTLPPAPLDATMYPAVLWDGGRLIVGGGYDGRNDHEGMASHRRTPAVFDSATATWETLPDGPRISFDGAVPADAPTGPAVQDDFGPPTFIVAADAGGGRGIHPWFLHDDAWEQAPFVSVHGDPDGLLVSSSDVDYSNPEEYPFELAVRDAPGRWRPAVPAPFTNRAGASVNATDGRIVLVGGYETSSMDPAASAWIFDPEG